VVAQSHGSSVCMHIQRIRLKRQVQETESRWRERLLPRSSCDGRPCSMFVSAPALPRRIPTHAVNRCLALLHTGQVCWKDPRHSGHYLGCHNRTSSLPCWNRHDKCMQLVSSEVLQWRHQRSSTWTSRNLLRW